jgi:hypothetical protein
MSNRTHVTLKVVGHPSDPELQQLIRVRSGPTVRCVWTPWSCGLCGSYTSPYNTYRVIEKTCSEHACLIPEELT